LAAGQEEYIVSLSEFALDRRGLLRAGGLAGGLLTAGGMLTACGGTSTDGNAPAGKPKRGGTLRFALGGASTSDTTDTHRTVSVWDIGIGWQLYNCLMWEKPVSDNPKDGIEVVPLLAESVEYDGPQKLVIRLRDGVEFHHGKTVTADDVLFSLRRIADPKDPKAGVGLVSAIDFQSSKAVGSRTVSLALSRPDAFLRSGLASTFTRIYPSDWDPKHAVGTGPWRLKEFAPGKSISFERFENYFDTPAWADELTFEGYNDPSALVNALTSGAVNCLGSVPGSQIKLLEANSRFKVVSSPTGAPTGMSAMGKQTAPFTDARVREAFKLMIDRESFVEQVYGGRATVGNDLFGPYSSEYAHDIPQREHDPEKAKALLAQAGVSPLELTLAVGGVVPNYEVAMAQSAKAAGVTMNVEKVDQSAFYSDHWMKDPFFTSSWTNKPVDQMVAFTMLPDAAYNETQENNPAVARLYNEASRILDEAKRNEVLKELQQVLWEDGGYIIPAFPDQIDAVSANVAGAHGDVTGNAFGSYDFKSMWLTS
jgi:peptide/nickel transport system substrate-binding protein